jgi:hypothetical protein
MATLLMSAGCIYLTDASDTGRSVWILGFARVTLPGSDGDLPKPVAFEIVGVGLSVGQVTQLGYFRNFEVRLRPESNSAVIIVRSKAEMAHLERVMTELQKKHLCIITRN